MSDLSSKSEQINFNLTSSAIVKVILVILALWFLYLVRDLLVILFVSLVFAAMIDPLASWLARHHIPRSIAVLIVYVIVFGLLTLGVVLIIPPLVSESQELGERFGVLLEKISNGTGFLKVKLTPESGFLNNLENILSSFETGLGRAWAGVFNTITGFFGGIVSFFLILVLTFYLVVEEGAMRAMLKAALPSRYHAEMNSLITKIQKKVSSWLKGQLFLGLIIGVVTYIALLLVQMPYALVLAFIAAITELIPYIGPVFGAIPAVFLAFIDSPIKGLIVLAVYVGIQQVERVFLVPKVMQKTLGLNPVVSIVALVAGFKVGGVLGALLALPVVAGLDVVVREYLERRNK